MDNPENINPTGSNMLSASKARVELDSGEISSEKLVRDCLDRIKTRDVDIEAWVYLDPELALEQAKTKDKETPKGLLHGIPIGIKDIIYTKDQLTTFGSKIYSRFKPEYDASVVSILKQVGIVIMGKTVTTEFAYMDPPPTLNPWDFQCTPGGSSSGSAVGVAAGIFPVALGTQTAGSVVRPASYNGVVGFKPTFSIIQN